VYVGVLVDHIFICSAPGAPAADRLRQFGLTEGSPNRHPGQGTACRRFFFRNFMLELLWVEDASDARSEQSRRTKLWDRWSAAASGASPFGIILRPEAGSGEPCPFASWEYRPATMPDLVLQIASGTSLEEPMWCYLEGGRPPAEARPDRRQPLEHPASVREMTGVRLLCPPLLEGSVTRAMADAKIIAVGTGAEHLLELEFDGGQAAMDFRPDLPLILRRQAA
jgi:glyoxalase-like protein